MLLQYKFLFSLTCIAANAVPTGAACVAAETSSPPLWGTITVGGQCGGRWRTGLGSSLSSFLFLLCFWCYRPLQGHVGDWKASLWYLGSAPSLYGFQLSCFVYSLPATPAMVEMWEGRCLFRDGTCLCPCALLAVVWGLQPDSSPALAGATAPAAPSRSFTSSRLPGCANMPPSTAFMQIFQAYCVLSRGSLLSYIPTYTFKRENNSLLTLPWFLRWLPKQLFLQVSSSAIKRLCDLVENSTG